MTESGVLGLFSPPFVSNALATDTPNSMSVTMTERYAACLQEDSMAPHKLLTFPAFCLWLLFGFAQVTAAQVGPPNPERDGRILFLEQSLEAQKRPAQIWQYGWTGGFIALAAANTALALNGESRTASIVNATKSFGSLAILLSDPVPSRLGASVMGSPADTDPEQRLALGEAALLANAKRARTRTGLRRHLTVLAANLIGGGIIWAAGDADGALVSSVSGFVIGEAQIWSEPDRAIRDKKSYRSRFGRDVGWSVRPGLNKINLVFQF